MNRLIFVTIVLTVMIEAGVYWKIQNDPTSIVSL